MKHFLTVSILLAAVTPVLFTSLTALAWSSRIERHPASGDVDCWVEAPSMDLRIVLRLWRQREVYKRIMIGLNKYPGSIIEINVDKEHYFHAAEDKPFYWTKSELLAAVLGGQTAWIEWWEWPGDQMQQEINLAGIEAAYNECVKATSP